MAATYGMIWAGLFADPVWFYAAIGLCFVQVIHFGIEDKNFFTLTSQVRYVMAAILAAGLWEPLRWIYWIPLAGLTVRLSLDYCLLARLIALLPWNHKQPFSAAFFKRVIFSKPTKGSILARAQ